MLLQLAAPAQGEARASAPAAASASMAATAPSSLPLPPTLHKPERRHHQMLALQPANRMGTEASRHFFSLSPTHFGCGGRVNSELSP